MMVRRTDLFAMLEMMSRYSLPAGVLLGTCSPWVEEVIHTLESSTTLSCDLTVLGNGVL